MLLLADIMLLQAVGWLPCLLVAVNVVVVVVVVVAAVVCERCC